jgi:hypothetical protein
MAFQCDQCRKSFSAAPHISITGRRLCDSCDDQLLGATAGAITGGVPGGIATAGWYSKVRKLGGRPPGSLSRSRCRTAEQRRVLGGQLMSNSLPSGSFIANA